MDDRLGVMITFAVMAGSATLVAFILGYVAHHDMGLSRLEIRSASLIASGSIAICLAIELFRQYRHKPK